MAFPRVACLLGILCFTISWGTATAKPEPPLALEVSPSRVPLHLMPASGSEGSGNADYHVVVKLTLRRNEPSGGHTVRLGTVAPDGTPVHERELFFHIAGPPSSDDGRNGALSFEGAWRVALVETSPGVYPVVFQAYLKENPDAVATATAFIDLDGPLPEGPTVPSSLGAPTGRVPGPGTAILVTVGVSGMAVAGLGNRHVRRLPAVMALFTRIPRTALLAHRTRRRIHEAIAQAPYIPRKDLQIALGIPRYALRFHLDKLVREGIVCEEGRRASRRYYLRAHRDPARGRASLTPRQSDVLAHLEWSGPATTGDLARELTMTKDAIRQHLKALVQAGLAERIEGFSGRRVAWRALARPRKLAKDGK